MELEWLDFEKQKPANGQICELTFPWIAGTIQARYEETKKGYNFVADRPQKHKSYHIYGVKKWRPLNEVD